MKLVRKRVTEQDMRFYRELAIPTPYGNFPMIPEEVVYDEDSDFYLYYIHGSGKKDMGMPMCFGYVWQEKTGYVSVYRTYKYDYEAEGYQYTWEICDVRYDGESIYLSDNFLCKALAGGVQLYLQKLRCCSGDICKAAPCA